MLTTILIVDLIVVVTFLVVLNRRSSDDNAAPTRESTETTVDSDEPGPDTASSFWPADHREVAVIASEDRIAITDGEVVVDLMEAESARFSASVAGGDQLVAINQVNELVALDLATGETARRLCPGCSGVAVVGDRIVTAGADFSMQVFDADLVLQSSVPVDHVSGPRTGEATDPISPTVRGVVDGKVAMSYLAPDGSGRGGPEILSLYSVDGALEQSWTIAGQIHSSAVSGDLMRLALGVGGSGGACYTLSIPVVVEPNVADPRALVPNGYEEREDATYRSDDLWWNGSELVTFGAFSGNAPSTGCIVDRVTRRFDLNGEIAATPTNGVSAYRFLGVGCEQALIVNTTEDPQGLDPGDHAHRLDVINADQRRTLEGYVAILWSAPRSETCGSFPGLSAP